MYNEDPSVTESSRPEEVVCNTSTVNLRIVGGDEMGTQCLGL
jgi:hypothetical protein